MIFGLNGEVKPIANVNQFTLSQNSVKQNTVKEDVIVKETLSVNETLIVKDTFNVKEVQEPLRKIQQDLFISEVQLQELTNSITETLNVKLIQAIDNVKKELDVKYASLYAKKDLPQNTQVEIPLSNGEPFAGFALYNRNPEEKQENLNVKDTNEINVKPDVKGDKIMLTSITGNALSENKEDFTIKESDPSLTDQVHFVDFPDEEESEEQIEETEKREENQNGFYDTMVSIKDNIETDTVKHLTINTDTVKDENTETQTENNPEQKYEWVQSRFYKDIEDQNEHLQDRLDFDSEDPALNWVNVRLRCIIENTIRLTEYRSIDRESLIKLTDALNNLLNSRSWNNLPDHFSVSQVLIELSERMNDLVRKNKNENIPLRISFKLKAQLVSIREQLKDAVPKVRFDELNFSEPHYQTQKENGLSGNKTTTRQKRYKKYKEAGLIDDDDDDDDNEEKDEDNQTKYSARENPYEDRFRHFERTGKFPSR